MTYGNKEDLERALLRVRRAAHDEDYYLEWAYGHPRLYLTLAVGGCKEISPRLPNPQMLTFLQAFADGIAVGYALDPDADALCCGCGKLNDRPDAGDICSECWKCELCEHGTPNPEKYGSMICGDCYFTNAYDGYCMMGYSEDMAESLAEWEVRTGMNYETENGREAYEAEKNVQEA